MYKLISRIKYEIWYFLAFRHFKKQGFHRQQASAIANNIAIMKSQKNK